MFSFPAPFESYFWRGRKIYLKRDDLLHPVLNGNKARKFEALLYLDLNEKTLVSYGGNQSNAMFALSYIAKLKGCDFLYVTPTPSTYLRECLQGNFAHALKNGMRLEFVSGGIDVLEDRARRIFESLDKKALFIPQGGACEIAKKGIERLALELREDMRDLKNPAVFYVSGSGASVAYLASFLPCIFSVGAAGDSTYLESLFKTIGAGLPENIISSNIKIPFGKPHKKLYEIYLEWLSLGVEFDLIYDCLGWLCLSENLKLFEDREIVFVHSGGLLGNLTQKLRYERIFL